MKNKKTITANEVYNSIAEVIQSEKHSVEEVLKTFKELGFKTVMVNYVETLTRRIEVGTADYKVALTYTDIDTLGNEGSAFKIELLSQENELLKEQYFESNEEEELIN